MLDTLLVTGYFIIGFLIYYVVTYRRKIRSLTSELSILKCDHRNAIRYTKERYGLDISKRI